jgi:L-aminopeptidase/D-esterase-like protein
MSVPEAVQVGPVPPGHFGTGENVGVKAPKLTALSITLQGPDGAVSVIVQLSVRVSFCLAALVQSIVIDVPELPLSISELKNAVVVNNNFPNLINSPYKLTKIDT